MAPYITPVFAASAPQLLWADLLVICAGILLALSLVTLAVGWERHLSWWVHLSALLPLAASVAAEVTAQHLYDTYASWAGFLPWGLPGVRLPQQFVAIVTGLLLAVRLCAAAAAQRALAHTPLPAMEREAVEQVLATACTALGEGVFAAAWDEGSVLSLDAAVAEALRGSQ